MQLTTTSHSAVVYGEVSVLGVFLNLLVLPTVGIVLGSGTAGALLGLVTVRGAFLAVVPGRIILRGYEVPDSAVGATFRFVHGLAESRKCGRSLDIIWFWQQRCGCTERV